MPISYSKTIEGYIEKQEKWREQIIHLRNLLNSCGLKEELKWGTPSYSINGKLIIGIAGFKNHFCLWFHQGVFLKDKEKKLINAQEGVTKALRQWRFEESDQIEDDLVLEYISEAMQNSIEGKEVKPQRKTGVSIPPLVQEALSRNKKIDSAFKKLTPGKQREYADHIGGAKREETKLSRLEKCMPMILEGKGLNDKYKNC